MAYKISAETLVVWRVEAEVSRDFLRNAGDKSTRDDRILRLIGMIEALEKECDGSIAEKAMAMISRLNAESELAGADELFIVNGLKQVNDEKILALQLLIADDE